MKPARRLLQLAALWAALALPLIWLDSSALNALWWALGALVLCIALLDGWYLHRQPPPAARRLLPSALSVQQPHPVRIQVRSDSLPAGTLLADHHPGDDPHTGLPCLLTPSDQELTELTYTYRPSRRGPTRFGDLEFWLPGRLGCGAGRWCLQPAMSGISRLPRLNASGLDASHTFLFSGTRLQPRRGEGKNSISFANTTPATACDRLTGRPPHAAGP